VALATLVAGLIAYFLGGNALFVACLGAVGVFFVGVVMWLSGERAWDEIGRAIMVSVVLAVVIGVPQYLIAKADKERDDMAAKEAKERDFRLSLALQENLTGANLEKADLEGIRLHGKLMRSADLAHANLRNAQLVDADLRGANLSGAQLQGADLRRAHLEGAYLDGAQLQEANLEDVDARGAWLPGAHLENANLELAGLVFSCLAGAQLDSARLAGADLAGAVLTNADVRGAQFENDLKPARIEFSGLAGAQYDDRTVWPLTFDRVDDAIRGVPYARDTSPTRPRRGLIPARVVDVVDGDTMRVEVDKRFQERLKPPGRTRLIGVDAPDLDDKGGPEAAQYVTDRVEGQRVKIELGHVPMDRRSRYLTNIWLSKHRTFNEELLETGLVMLKIRENRGLELPYEAAEIRARQKGIGLWRTCPKSEFSE